MPGDKFMEDRDTVEPHLAKGPVQPSQLGQSSRHGAGLSHSHLWLTCYHLCQSFPILLSQLPGAAVSQFAPKVKVPPSFDVRSFT